MAKAKVIEKAPKRFKGALFEVRCKNGLVQAKTLVKFLVAVCDVNGYPGVTITKPEEVDEETL